MTDFPCPHAGDHFTSPEDGPVPSVGLFWGVGTGHGPFRLVTAAVPLTAAEPYGDCLTDPRAHHAVWRDWRRQGATALARGGLPVDIAAHPYEHFPRGRVVHRVPEALFIIYADRRLQAPDIVAELVRLFGLTGRRVDVHSDAHYRSRA